MNGRKYFLTAKNGAFHERPAVKGDTADVFNKITGHIMNIAYKETDRGDIIRVHVVDENNFYLLSLFANSRAAHGFYMLIKNVDLLQPVTLSIKTAHGKDCFYALQNGVSVRWAYGVDTGDLPKPIEQRLPFLKSMVMSEIMPILQKKINPFPNHLIYQPFKKSGLQGGYFDAYASTGRVVGPVGSAEQQYYDEHGRI